jgi:ABC-type transport system involved in multi-copper enzyme maturation permease subunit
MRLDSTNPLRFSCRRTLAIARNTIREAVRQRLFAFIALLAAGLVVGVQWLSALNFGSSELKFIADFGFGTLAFFGAALAILATSQLFFSEIEHRTVLTLLSKPMRRSEFVVGKFAGVALVTAGFCAVITVLLVTVLWTRESELMRSLPDAFQSGRAVDYVAVLGAGFAQWLKLALLSALTLLVASFSRTQLFTSAAGFMILVICHLQFLAENATANSNSGISRLVAVSLATVVPDFQLFDFTDSLGSGDAIVWSQLTRLALYTALYIVAVCCLAAFTFRRREI